MPEIDKAVAKFNLNYYYDQALNLIERPRPQRVRSETGERQD